MNDDELTMKRVEDAFSNAIFDYGLSEIEARSQSQQFAAVEKSFSKVRFQISIGEVVNRAGLDKRSMRGAFRILPAIAASVLIVALSQFSPLTSGAAWASDPQILSASEKLLIVEACSVPLRKGLGELETSGASSSGRNGPAMPSDMGAVPELTLSLPPLTVVDIRNDRGIALFSDSQSSVTCPLVKSDGVWKDQGISVIPNPGESLPGVSYGGSTTFNDGNSISYVTGIAPSGTTAVKIALVDGRTMTASLTGLTYLAWVPSDLQIKADSFSFD
jgi:hypothetical protein